MTTRTLHAPTRAPAPPPSRVPAYTVTPAPHRPPAPTEEMIRHRAYEHYLARNGGPGDALDDWLRAETELKGEYGRRGGVETP